MSAIDELPHATGQDSIIFGWHSSLATNLESRGLEMYDAGEVINESGEKVTVKLIRKSYDQN